MSPRTIRKRRAILKLADSSFRYDYCGGARITLTDSRTEYDASGDATRTTTVTMDENSALDLFVQARKAVVHFRSERAKDWERLNSALKEQS